MNREIRTIPIDSPLMPPGIPYIIGNEAAERFSFYGMRAILVVFMTKYLWLMDGRAGGIRRALSDAASICFARIDDIRPHPHQITE